MRFRDTSDDPWSSTSSHWWWCEWAGYDPAPNERTHAVRTSTKYMWDIVTPNFHQLIAKGEIINNPMYKYRLVDRGNGSIFYAEGTWDSSYLRVKSRTVEPPIEHLVDSSFYPSDTMTAIDGVLDSDDFTAGRELAVSAAWANVDESEIQALASLAEMPETIKWVSSLLYRARKLISTFLSKKRALRKLLKGTNPADAFSDFWLEFRYAFRPLVFEMQQAVAALEKAVERELRHTARGFQRETVTDVHESTHDYWIATQNRRTVSTIDSNYRAGVLYAIKVDIDEINAVWGLDQPIETIWELTPFSFIIDWFFNIGDVISSWSVSSSLEARASWIVEHHRFGISTSQITLKAENSEAAKNANLTFDVETPGSRVTECHVTRRLPSPERPFTPHLNINLDAGKLLDLATIGRKLFSALRKA